MPKSCNIGGYTKEKLYSTLDLKCSPLEQSIDESGSTKVEHCQYSLPGLVVAENNDWKQTPFFIVRYFVKWGSYLLAMENSNAIML